ncbi:MAG: hypothetical protein KJ955_08745 [Nanoarchaeota archaeon]|nr:hypothetical protein [Nanoarchaeota archaeon]
MKITILITIFILLSFSAYAQYEALAGIAAESPEYNDYKLCIDSCSQCEQSCKASTYRRAAEAQNKEEFCNYLPEGEKAMCRERIYMANAIQNKNSAECQKITDEFQKTGCLLNVQTEKAIAGESEAECDSLEPSFAESCRLAFNMRMASSKADESYCNKIADESAKSMCLENAKMQKGEAAEPAKEEAPAIKPKAGKNLIIYGIIILGVIIFAATAVIIIKKINRKKQAQPSMAQQTKGPPLMLQNQQPVQQFPKAGIGTGVPDQLSSKQKTGESK